MKVEIWSDVMCPFCYIGKRRFENALQHFEHKDEVEIIKPVILHCMQTALALPNNVPTDAEVGVGDNWLAAH